MLQRMNTIVRAQTVMASRFIGSTHQMHFIKIETFVFFYFLFLPLQVLLHSPSETPKIAYYGTAIANGFESRIVILPTLSEASYSVRKVARGIRQCLFESENYLTFYR